MRSAKHGIERQADDNQLTALVSCIPTGAASKLPGSQGAAAGQDEGGSEKCGAAEAGLAQGAGHLWRRWRGDGKAKRRGLHGPEDRLDWERCRGVLRKGSWLLWQAFGVASY